MRFLSLRFPPLLLLLGAFACSEPSLLESPPDNALPAFRIYPESVQVGVGGNVTVTTAAADKSGGPAGDVAWSIEDTTIAVVSLAGTVTGLRAGSTQLLATRRGRSEKAPVKVDRALGFRVLVTPQSTTLPVGASAQFSAVITDANGTPVPGRQITWRTADSAIATVTSSGVVTAVGVGAVQVRAASDGVSGIATVTTSNAPVAAVSIDPGSLSLAVGATHLLVATPKDSSGTSLAGRGVQWTTSDGAVATVSSEGLVTGIAPGSARIKASVPLPTPTA